MIILENVRLKIFNQLLLENESIDIYEGYIHVIMGESGSGKTTLLHEISLLSHVSDASYQWDDQRIDQLNDDERALLRRSRIGYILQDMELISEDLSLRDNIACMFALRGLEYDEAKVEEYMQKLHLTCSLDQTVEQMSRGERQRFALVLALIKDVELIVCDEPTSALDIENTKALMGYLKLIARDYHKMIVIATHDRYVEECADILYRIKDKHLIRESRIEGDHHEKIVYKNYPITKDFYQIYKKSHKGISQWAGNIFYVILILVLCIAPLVLNAFIEKQEKLYEMYASQEIIVVNTKTPIPMTTYNAKSEVFNESQLNLLHEMKYIDKVSYYWEMDGSLYNGQDYYEVRIIPKENIEHIVISTSLVKECTQDTTLYASLLTQDQSYDFELKIDQYDIEDYPPRSNISCEIIYMPTNMMTALLQQHHIDQSSSAVVYVDDMSHIEDTSKEIQRWFPTASLYSSGSQYASQIETMKNIQQFMIVLRIVILVGTIALCFMIQTLENKARAREISHLRINGMNKKSFYKLCYYENIYLLICTILCSLLGYIVIVFYLDLPLSLLNIGIIFIQLIIYIIITRIVPIFISVLQIFKRDISSILRDNV